MGQREGDGKEKPRQFTISYDTVVRLFRHFVTWRHFVAVAFFGCGTLSGPVLHDTARLSQRCPPIARYGVFGVSTWPIGCDTPFPFSECLPLGEHAKWRCNTPSPPKGVSQRYLQGKWVRYPPLRYYLERVLRDRGGGVSRAGPLRWNIMGNL